MSFDSTDIEGEVACRIIKQIDVSVVWRAVRVSELKPAKIARANRVDGSGSNGKDVHRVGLRKCNELHKEEERCSLVL